MSMLLRTTAVLALGGAIMGLTGVAHAVVCAPDVVPAATLLVPLFEVDVEQCAEPAGARLDTELTIGNATAHPVLAGVTLWSDWGVPVTGFQVYLPGEASQTMALGDFLCHGVVPQTGPAVSPHPPGTAAPVAFPSCNNSVVPGAAPNYQLPAAADWFLYSVRQALTGQYSPLYDAFFGQEWGDGVARGYVTVDVLNECHLMFPSMPGYFVPGGLGIAGNENALVGSWSLTDPNNNFRSSAPAVRLESSDELQGGDFTFYGWIVGYSAADAREPLPTTFASTFVGAPFFEESQQVLWRERTAAAPSYSPMLPAPLPLNETLIGWFDDEAAFYDSIIPPTFPGEPPVDLVSYPVVTHAYGPSEVPFPASRGWQFSNLQNFQSSTIVGQSWMVTRSHLWGRYQTSVAATPLDTSCVDAFGFVPLTITVAPTGGLQAPPPTWIVFWADFQDSFGGWSDVVGVGQ